ncbi:MAG: FAD-dependent oxidoreductase [Gammaproteobacteria bacterium]
MSDNNFKKRRSVLQSLGAAGAVAALSGCTGTGRRARFQRPLSRQPFVAPRISRDRIVRTIVGHRPYRAAGFVVRREQMDGTTVVHNYGHGGGGITLSWGSSALAVREVADVKVGSAAVIGAGIMGLTTARLLQDAGWSVTLYTRDVGRHSTSNVGAGQWAPTSVFRENVASPEFKRQFETAARISHHAYQNLVGANYGVRFIENYYLSHRALHDSYYLRELPDLFTSIKTLAPHEHPFAVEHVRRTVTMLIEPALFLRKVRDDFYRAGGQLKVRHFKHVDEILALDESTVFNCTGLGAKALFGDDQMIPIKGQLVFLPPDPAVDYLTVGGGRGVSYMFPRVGEIVLGGSYQHNDWSTHVEPEVTERIIDAHMGLFKTFG